MIWRADTHIITPDHEHKSRRTIFFEAPDREAAIELVPVEVKKGGYSGYELRHVTGLEPF